MDIANRYAGNIYFSVPNSMEKKSVQISRNNAGSLSIVPNSFLYSEIFIQWLNKESISFIDDKLEKLSKILDS